MQHYIDLTVSNPTLLMSDLNIRHDFCRVDFEQFHIRYLHQLRTTPTSLPMEADIRVEPPRTFACDAKLLNGT
eukprot:7849706-Heterocapsa_arctica.AAC.1